MLSQYRNGKNTDLLGLCSQHVMHAWTTYIEIYNLCNKISTMQTFTSNGWWHFDSDAVQKSFGHSSQTYGFTPSCRCMCFLRLPFWLKFIWQMWHVNQVPSLCDISRCVFSWRPVPKHSEQCLHENGFAPVWTQTWRFKSVTVTNWLKQ